MRLTTSVAFLIGLAVFVIAAMTSAKDPKIFLNAHAALVVFGGTLSASAISFGFQRLFMLSKVFLRRLIYRQATFNPQALIEQMMVFSEVYRTNPEQLAAMTETVKDHFLKESLQMAAENFLPPEDMVRLLATRTVSIFDRYMEDAVKFKALAKFPPAFGLMGAVMGMVGIMSELGTGGASATVGKSLALALVGTLYGVMLANIFILPLAENLLDSARDIRAKNSLIVKAMELLLQKKNPVMMAEELNSYLLASERVDWKKSSRRTKRAA
jgi:chemotaxis protein MotA